MDIWEKCGRIYSYSGDMMYPVFGIGKLKSRARVRGRTRGVRRGPCRNNLSSCATDPMKENQIGVGILL
jgi:hypothetical protein